MKLIAPLGLVALTSVLLACRATPAETTDNSGSALVSDIASMTQNADGTFEVTCKDGHVEHSVTTDAIHGDAVCQPRKPRYQCELIFYSNQSSGSVVVDQHADFFDGYPTFNITLGGSTPYELDASAVPAGHADGTSSTTDGYFSVTIKNVATGTTTYTQSEVALDHLGVDGQGGVEASYAQVDAPEFTYSGQTYNLVIGLCELYAAPN